MIKKWAGPVKVQFEQLDDWTNHANTGIKHYSGTAHYRKNFNLTAKDIVAERPLYLDLGKVQQIAEVTVNGEKTRDLMETALCIGY
ncbi:hypothetical protein RS130_00215 [Paraglaciecola aquimarina]|uniref:Uncharacterized protein n=1 Tax=Paraglaciecola aquimarina TaxID=1235557 RepID=A0ABU3SRB4_9ALTE|nr:glycosylhydrolase-like jelly roll fold domain-containing protein [Paraglaciecola aquimarina]MDU0352536.1 hypothetical protein [Paraglaciecola aquimarina]